MISQIHRVLGLTVDYAAFRSLNFWHWRHHVNASTQEDVLRYGDQWLAVPASEYYSLPENSTIPLSSVKIDPGKAQRINFQSPHPCDYEENNRVGLDIFLCRPWSEAPVMIFMHGFMSASDTGYHIWCKLMNKRGINAIFLHLPYHYSRRPKNFVSGELAISADLTRLAEGIRQSVKELRLLISDLKTLGTPKIGLFGMSYGGWIGALTTRVDTNVNLLTMVEPIVDISHVMWESLAARTMRRQLQKKGVGEESLSRLFSLVCPFEGQANCPGENILMLAGSYDQIAPPHHVKRLAQYWGAHYREYAQAHCGYKLQYRGWEDMQELLLPRFIL
ncbi:MAG: alpha/beta hydrolase family protein [Verrucomicrobiota bacterium]|nr:alpha/beta hydrolase family protein [Verrucomicrobiota bacterium]